LRDAPKQLTAIDPDAQLFESGARNVLTTASPEHQGVITASWESGYWHLLSRARHFGSVERDRGFASQWFRSDTLVDVAVTRSLGSALRVTLGADNVFDRRAERSSESLDFGGNFAYEVITPAGANGRFLYAKASYRF
jgi:iron complex outermembrane receptor protein